MSFVHIIYLTVAPLQKGNALEHFGFLDTTLLCTVVKLLSSVNFTKKAKLSL